MNRYSRKFAWLLSLVIMCTMIVPGLAEKEPVVIKYIMWDNSVKETEIEKIIKPFEAANPGIKVDIQAMPFGEYWKKIQVSIAADDPYDVFAMSVAYSWEFAHKGMVMNLQPMYDRIVAEKGKDFLYGSMMNPLRYPSESDDLYGMPYAWVGSLLFYNKTMFDEAGLEYPNSQWTYDDMWAAAQKLSSGEGPARKYGFQVDATHEFIDAYINAAGGRVLNEGMTECLLNEDASVKAVEELYSKIQSGIAPTPSSLQGQPDVFMSGKVAMKIAASYNIDLYREIKDFDWDVAMVPINALTGKRVVYGGPDSLAIAANCKHPEEAMKFLEYYCFSGRDVSSYMGGKASIAVGLTEDEAWLEKDLKPSNKQALLDSAPFMKGADFSYKWMEWRVGVMTTELGSAFNGEKTVKQACEDATKQINAILEEIKPT